MTVAVGYLDERFAPYPPRLSVEQCAELLMIEPVTAYRWLNKGLIPAHQKGRTWLIYRDEVLEDLKNDLALRRATGLDDDESDAETAPDPGDDQQQ